jgi:hypothetical protein
MNSKDKIVIEQIHKEHLKEIIKENKNLVDYIDIIEK